MDALIIATKTEEEVQHVKELLPSRFMMTDMGELHYYLGIAITMSGKLLLKGRLIYNIVQWRL